MRLSGRARLAGLALPVVLIAGAWAAPPHGEARAGAGPSAVASAVVPSDGELGRTLDAALAQPEFERVRAVVVLAHGRTEYERYMSAQSTDHHQVSGLTRSVVATLIGIAIDEGLIGGTDQTLAELLPDRVGQMPAELARATLGQLLTNRAGVSDETVVDGAGRAVDWVGAVLGAPPLPAGQFHYSSGGAHLLAAVLAEATGMPVVDYARSRLLDPLGIAPIGADLVLDPESPGGLGAGFAWPADPQGLTLGAYGLRLSVRDMARIGQLYLQQGMWNGTQLVPRRWVRESTSRMVDVSTVDGYGYQWWTGVADDGSSFFYAGGETAQVVLVMPSRQVVVAYQTQWDPAGDGASRVYADMRELIQGTVLPAFA